MEKDFRKKKIRKYFVCVNSKLTSVKKRYLKNKFKEVKKINENNNLIKYEGSAEDVEGLATGTSVGNALNWTYDIYLNIKGSNLKVKFNDWIYKQDSNVAINRAYVSKFGIDIGSVTLVFLKGQTAKTVSPLNINSW